MVTGAAYLVGTHHSSFQAGRPARILGVVTARPEGQPNTRLCYEVLFSDGQKDHVPLCDSANFEVITQDQFDRGEFPKVTN